MRFALSQQPGFVLTQNPVPEGGGQTPPSGLAVTPKYRLAVGLLHTAGRSLVSIWMDRSKLVSKWRHPSPCQPVLTTSAWKALNRPPAGCGASAATWAFLEGFVHRNLTQSHSPKFGLNLSLPLNPGKQAAGGFLFIKISQFLDTK